MRSFERTSSACAPSSGPIAATAAADKSCRLEHSLSFERSALQAAAVIGGLVFLANAAAYRGSLIDDAFISLRYARHLVEGLGPVFNPGEAVEGYSNPTWMLLGAAALRLDIDPIAALKTTSLLSTLGIFLLLRRLQRRLLPADSSSALLWLLPAASVAYLATTTIETAHFTLLFLAVVVAVAGDARSVARRALPLWGILLALSRPEGAALFALAWSAGLLLDRAREGSALRRESFIALLVFGLGYAAFLGWRLHTYGELLPNTYFARMTHGPEQLASGLRNLSQWALEHPPLAAAVVLPLPLLFWPPTRAAARAPLLLFVWWLALAMVLLVVAEGGDFMPFFRFFAPVSVLAALLLSGCLSAVRHLLSPWLRTALIPALVAMQATSVLWSDEPERAFVSTRTTEVGLLTGRHLARQLPANAWLALNTSGAIPWSSRLRTIDTLGLTDAEIARAPVFIMTPAWTAHRRGCGECVLARHPRVVLWYNTAGLDEPYYLGDHQLADDPYFRFFYQLKRTAITDGLPATKPLARLLGWPFGRQVSGDTTLGIRTEPRRAPLPHTVVHAAPIELRFFELRQDLTPLWGLRESGADVDGFLDGVVQALARVNEPPEGPQAAAEVEALCAAAREAVLAGRNDNARELLSRAQALNQRARSPLVGHYVANLAYLEGDLWLAVQAQIEALRHDPHNALYRGNLRRLLTVPWRTFQVQRREGGAGA